MNKKINDKIFGEMEYKFGWFKKEIYGEINMK